VVASYALERRSEWSKSTWRQVKAALVFWYESKGGQDAATAVSMLRGATQSSCHRRTGRTSGMRSKSVTQKALMSVISGVRATGSAYAAMLEAWLVLGAVFGLRPHEWCHAELLYLSPAEVGDRDAAGDGLVPYLRVRNAKATNGRAHGEFRHLNLQRLAPEVVESAGNFAVLMAGIFESGRYKSSYGACSKLLYRVNARLHRNNRSKWVQLYSARHHFSSDAKKNLDASGVGALMGHKTTKTASEHYGRRASGGALGPRPIASEVSRVRVRRARMQGHASAPSVAPGATAEPKASESRG
jgi:hypothetical protein